MYPGGTVVLAGIYFYGGSASKVALIKIQKKNIVESYELNTAWFNNGFGAQTNARPVVGQAAGRSIVILPTYPRYRIISATFFSRKVEKLCFVMKTLSLKKRTMSLLLI
jgi:hypothetical protein